MIVYEEAKRIQEMTEVHQGGQVFKKYAFLFIIALFLTGSVFTANVRNAAAGIKGGYHDLTFTGSGGFASYPVEEVCVFCHAPHNTNMDQTYGSDPTAGSGGGTLNGKFLWNRRIPLATAFQVYTSSSLNPSTLTQGGPGTLSLLCLSCHDGIGAMNVLLSYPDNIPIDGVLYKGTADQFGDVNLSDPNIGPLNIGEAVCTGDGCTGGTDLRNDHPIGFDYEVARTADPTGLKVITDPALVKRMTITGNRLECNTCHDPHITNTPALKNKFLVVSNAGSALCLDCHNK
jgi:predicted CXXCH cytochrome family protein